MSDWILSTDPARLDLDRVHAWLAAQYWSPGVRRDVVARAFAASLAVGAYDPATGAQVAVARAATDRATFAWIADVYVEPCARGAGLARALVRRLLEHPDLQTVRRFLLGTRDAHGVYAPLGFAPVEPTTFMALTPDPARWR